MQEKILASYVLRIVVRHQALELQLNNLRTGQIKKFESYDKLFAFLEETKIKHLKLSSDLDKN